MAQLPQLAEYFVVERERAAVARAVRGVERRLPEGAQDRLFQGGTTTLDGTTGTDGTVSVKYRLKPSSPTGTYQVKASAMKGTITGNYATTFNVPYGVLLRAETIEL